MQSHSSLSLLFYGHENLLNIQILFEQHKNRCKYWREFSGRISSKNNELILKLFVQITKFVDHEKWNKNKIKVNIRVCFIANKFEVSSIWICRTTVVDWVCKTKKSRKASEVKKEFKIDESKRKVQSTWGYFFLEIIILRWVVISNRISKKRKLVRARDRNIRNYPQKNILWVRKLSANYEFNVQTKSHKSQINCNVRTSEWKREKKRKWMKKRQSEVWLNSHPGACCILF